MSITDAPGLLDDMTDDELRKGAAEVRIDIANAATEEPESEWHQACFAAALTYAWEMQRRGLTLATIH